MVKYSITAANSLDSFYIKIYFCPFDSNKMTDNLGRGRYTSSGRVDPFPNWLSPTIRFSDWMGGAKVREVTF